jgi:hypothetical protein
VFVKNIGAMFITARSFGIGNLLGGKHRLEVPLNSRAKLVRRRNDFQRPIKEKAARSYDSPGDPNHFQDDRPAMAWRTSQECRTEGSCSPVRRITPTSEALRLQYPKSY